MLQPDPGGDVRFVRSPANLRVTRPSLSLVPSAPQRGEASEKIRRFFAETPHEHPVLAMDLDIVDWNYLQLAWALPETAIYYAVKANPAREILTRLAALGSRFDVASRGEVELCLSCGIDASRLSFGNTIKKERDIAFAHAAGVSLFSVDAEEELEKIARAAPGADVFARILTKGEGAEWPLSRKFGCTPEMAEGLLVRARDLGLNPRGVSFHVGSQQADLDAWDAVLAEVAAMFERLDRKGIHLDLVNLGGGFPAKYRHDVRGAEAYGDAIRDALARRFGTREITTIAEPGRGLVGDAGVIRSEVVLVSRKDVNEDVRWVFLDIGMFSGLAETMGEAIKYRLQTSRDGKTVETGRVVIAGPSCDSADVMYEHSDYRLPLSLTSGDEVLILSTGAYTSTYSSVGFNGFPPLETVCL